MNLLALTLMSHLTVAAFKPLNLFKAITRTQTAEEIVKPLSAAVAEAFGRAAQYVNATDCPFWIGYALPYLALGACIFLQWQQLFEEAQMKYKVYIPDSPTIVGGWNKVGTIEAENEQEALSRAKDKWGDKVMIKKVKQPLTLVSKYVIL